MVDFIKIYRKDIETLVIEFIPDIFIASQPINENDYTEKLPRFTKIIGELNSYTLRNRLKQVVVIDCDKCVQIHKFNFVYFVRIVRFLGKKYKNTDLLTDVQILHTNSMIKTVYNGMKSMIPSSIFDLVHLY